MLSLQVTGVVEERERERKAGAQGVEPEDGGEGVDAQVVLALLKQLWQAQVNIKYAL